MDAIRLTSVDSSPPSVSPPFLSSVLLRPGLPPAKKSLEEKAALSLIERLPSELLGKIFELVFYRSISELEANRIEANRSICAIRGTCRTFYYEMQNVFSHLDAQILRMEATLSPHALVLTPALYSGYCSKFSDIGHYKDLFSKLFRQLFPGHDITRLSKAALENVVGKSLKSLIKPHLNMKMDLQAALASAPFIPGRICRTMQYLVGAPYLLQEAALGNPQHPEVVAYVVNNSSSLELEGAISDLLSEMAKRNPVPTDADRQIRNIIDKRLRESIW